MKNDVLLDREQSSEFQFELTVL